MTPLKLIPWIHNHQNFINMLQISFNGQKYQMATMTRIHIPTNLMWFHHQERLKSFSQTHLTGPLAQRKAWNSIGQEAKRILRQIYWAQENVRGTCDQVQARVVSELQVLEVHLHALVSIVGEIHASSCMHLHATQMFIKYVLVFIVIHLICSIFMYTRVAGVIIQRLIQEC